MKILAIETSCDETAVAVTKGRRVLSNVIFSQIDIHRKYGGVYPSLARRAHEERIDLVVEKALKDARARIGEIGAIGVTFGQGLVIALEVGLRKAKELAQQNKKPLIPIDHTEGHIYSCFAQNRNANPSRKFKFPFLALIISGGYTGLVLVKGHLEYEVLGKTLDDAAGEALDKAAKLLNMSYPGGPVIEELAKKGDSGFLDLPVPMIKHPSLNFSYSGLKTAFKNKLKNKPQEWLTKNLSHLSASFQEAVLAEIINRLKKATLSTGVNLVVVGGGVVANQRLRRLIRKSAKELKFEVYFPHDEKLIGDNAAMIGVAAHFKYQKGIYLTRNFDRLERVARPDLKLWVAKK
jgi:N6-L-threonylcarbamoyladenine synthase